MRRNVESSDLEPISLEPVGEADPVAGGRTPPSAGALYRRALAAAAVIASLALVVTAFAALRVAQAEETQACLASVGFARSLGVGARGSQEAAAAASRQQLQACGIEAPAFNNTGP